MQWNGIKIPIVILAFVLGLASFWGIQKVYNEYSYERPLTKLLSEDKSIATYHLNDQHSVLEITVKLSKTKDLQKVYRDLDQRLKNVLGKREYKIVLQDQRDQTLEHLYLGTRMAAYEAIERGNYLEMEAYIMKMATAEDSKAKVSIDQENLYIQIEHGNNYLQEIIPRTKVSDGTGAERGGTS